jgi:hypothetical protein
MPGGDNTPQRTAAVRRLRAAGLRVDTSAAFGADLDAALARGRVHAYYPAGPAYRHFATQRLLLGINKGAPTVAVRSDDERSEWLYAGLYDTCLLDQTASVVAPTAAAAPVPATALAPAGNDGNRPADALMPAHGETEEGRARREALSDPFVRACIEAAARPNWRERGLQARDLFAARCDAQQLFEGARAEEQPEHMTLVAWLRRPSMALSDA